MTTKKSRGPRPGQLRNDPAVRAAIASAFDAVLARRPEHAAEAGRARHLAAFENAWATLGYPNDPALKRRTFAQVLPQLEAHHAQNDARRALASTLAADDHRRRRAAARALGRAQGRARALQEHFAASAEASRALTAALDERIARTPRVRLIRLV